MHHIRALRNQLREQRNPGHEIGTFLLSHTNSLNYLIDHLEGYLAAARADQEAERAFAGGLLRGLKQEKRNITFDILLAKIEDGQYDGIEGFNQFRHDVSAHYGDGELLDGFLAQHSDASERLRLVQALTDFLAT